MPSEWAYEIAREQRRDVETMATNLDAARAQGRREGLEEAAKVADAHEDHVGFEHDSQRDACVRFIAAEIRALVEESAAQEPTA